MRQAVYRDLFRVHIDPELLKGLRQATQTNRVFGADYFQKQIEAALAVRIAKRKPGPRRRESPFGKSGTSHALGLLQNRVLTLRAKRHR